MIPVKIAHRATVGRHHVVAWMDHLGRRHSVSFHPTVEGESDLDILKRLHERLP